MRRNLEPNTSAAPKRSMDRIQIRPVLQTVQIPGARKRSRLGAPDRPASCSRCALFWCGTLLPCRCSSSSASCATYGRGSACIRPHVSFLPLACHRGQLHLFDAHMPLLLLAREAHYVSLYPLLLHGSLPICFLLTVEFSCFFQHEQVAWLPDLPPYLRQRPVVAVCSRHVQGADLVLAALQTRVCAVV